MPTYVTTESTASFAQHGYDLLFGESGLSHRLFRSIQERTFSKLSAQKRRAGHRSVGCSMRSRTDSDLAINALLMAVRRRNPTEKVVVHSDQGSQYTSYHWQSFLKAHDLEASMSWRGSCYDNAVAESFFRLLKRERIPRKIHVDREEARRDIFDYINLLYIPNRRHGHADGVSPTEFENQYFDRQPIVYVTRGESIHPTARLSHLSPATHLQKRMTDMKLLVSAPLGCPDDL